jgi:hypothetical protein
MSRDLDIITITGDELDKLRDAMADRDRLASDLQAKTAELERVRRNHLRKMLRQAQLAARTFSHIAKQGGLSARPLPPKTLRRAERNRIRFASLSDALCAALATMEPKA